MAGLFGGSSVPQTGTSDRSRRPNVLGGGSSYTTGSVPQWAGGLAGPLAPGQSVAEQRGAAQGVQQPAGGAGGFGGGATTTQLDFPEAQPYQPYGGGGIAAERAARTGARAQGSLGGNIGAVSEAGAGLLDPESDYYKRLSAEMGRQIGGQAAAGQRSAALRGAWGGLGGGQGGEVMQTAADIGQAGLEARGVAESGLALQAPGMGAGMLGSTFGPLLGIEQLGEQSRQFGAGLGEGSRQFGAGLGLQQQQMAQQGSQFGAGMDLQYQQLAQQRQQMEQDAHLRELALQYGAF